MRTLERFIMNPNLTTDRPTFVTHLECSLTGEHYAADQLHNLSAAGKPLLVRYDLRCRARVPAARDGRGARQPICGGGANCCRYGAPKTSSAWARSRRHWCRSRGRAAGRTCSSRTKGRLPTGSFKARGLVMAVAMAKELGVTKIAMPTNGNAGAALAAYASRVGIETIVFLSRRHAGDQRARDRSCRARASTASTG